MNKELALETLKGLLDAFDLDNHGDYFYEHGWEVCEAVILAYGALENQLESPSLPCGIEDDECPEDCGYSCRQ